MSGLSEETIGQFAEALEFDAVADWTFDPPLRAGQVVVMRSGEERFAKYGGLVRADRLLAEHPDPMAGGGGRKWIYEPAPVPCAVKGDGIGVIPERNLKWCGFVVDHHLTALVTTRHELEAAVKRWLEDELRGVAKVEPDVLETVKAKARSVGLLCRPRFVRSPVEGAVAVELCVYGVEPDPVQ